MLFDNWSDILHTIIVGLLGYLALLALLRVAGKRTIAQMNAFDLVVTVAIGSSLATVVLDPTISVAEGAAAFAVLMGGQLLITLSTRRWAIARKLVLAQPTLLVYDGSYLDAMMRRERMSPEDVRAAIRSQGIGSMDEVGAVVLETNGTLSVVRGPVSPALLKSVQGVELIGATRSTA